jgi:hypothetical protein
VEVGGDVGVVGMVLLCCLPGPLYHPPSLPLPPPSPLPPPLSLPLSSPPQVDVGNFICGVLEKDTRISAGLAISSKAEEAAKAEMTVAQVAATREERRKVEEERRRKEEGEGEGAVLGVAVDVGEGGSSKDEHTGVKNHCH